MVSDVVRVLLLEASPKQFTLIDRRRVADDAWAHVAVVDQHVFVRALTGMNVFRWQ